MSQSPRCPLPTGWLFSCFLAGAGLLVSEIRKEEGAVRGFPSLEDVSDGAAEAQGSPGPQLPDTWVSLGRSRPLWGEAPSFCLLWATRVVHKLAGPEGKGSGGCLERVGRTYSGGWSRESPIPWGQGGAQKRRELSLVSQTVIRLCNPRPLGH